MEKLQKQFHKSRRDKLLSILDKNSLVIIPGSTHVARSYDDAYRFKQNKNFYYLTGFNEADALLVLAPGGMKVSGNRFKKEVFTKEILFVQPKNPLRETWTGRRLGFSNVKSKLGINTAFENTKIWDVLNDVISKDEANRIYVSFFEMFKLSGVLKEHLTKFIDTWITATPNIQLIDINHILGKMRSVKNEFETDQMRYAATVTAASFYNAIQNIRPGLFEYHVQAMLEFNYKNLGADDIAFETIVAGGNNACILHYNTNKEKLKDGDLVLIDSGAEYNYYNGDLTRTVPVNGIYTKEQREIYKIVLDAQAAVIKKIKPGVKLTGLKAFSVKQLEKGMKKLGILKKGFDPAKYTLHGVGHHLGLDTHDAVTNRKIGRFDFDTLLAGNVITVEPGLYFPEDSKEIPEKYRGIGVRIEDDVLVTKHGSEVLSDALPKQIADIEKLMK